MLNILKKKEKNFVHYKALNTIKNTKNIQSQSEKGEHKNTIYYPSSSKE
jgi:hypothetical protein